MKNLKTFFTSTHLNFSPIDILQKNTWSLYTTALNVRNASNSRNQRCIYLLNDINECETVNLTKKQQLPLNQCLSDSNLDVFLEGICAYLQQRNICLYVYVECITIRVSGSFPSEWWYCLLGGLTCTFREINHCIVTYSLR